MVRYRDLCRRRVIRTGVSISLFNNMDDITIRRHLRLNIVQLDMVSSRFDAMGLESDSTVFSFKIKTVMFLWYMANQNCFREVADKFNISDSYCHKIIAQCLDMVSNFSKDFITWPNDCEKRAIAVNFRQTSGQENVIGAIDGCHIKILKPLVRGQDYINRKGFFSILLQGICDNKKN